MRMKLILWFVLPVYINVFRLSLQDVDYEATMATKLSIAKKVFSQEKDLILNSKSFQKFFSENEVLLCSTFFLFL